MNPQRPIVPARPATDSSVAQRPIVPQQRESVASAPIVPRRAVVPAPAPVVARAMTVRTHASSNFVLDDEIDRAPPPSKVCLGDVAGQQLSKVVREIKDNTHRRRVLEDFVRADPCYVDETYVRPRRRVLVEYVRALKSKPPVAFTEAELSVPHPVICYQKGLRFGSEPYLQIRDDRYTTEHEVRGKWVPVCAKGMDLQMVLERRSCSYDRWMYRPCTNDGEIIQDFDLVGSVSDMLFEKQSTDLPNQLRDVDWNAITLNDIESFLCVIEFSRDEGTGIEIILVLDRERKVRCIVHEKQVLDDPDPELDCE